MTTEAKRKGRVNAELARVRALIRTKHREVAAAQAAIDDLLRAQDRLMKLKEQG